LRLIAIELISFVLLFKVIDSVNFLIGCPYNFTEAKQQLPVILWVV